MKLSLDLRATLSQTLTPQQIQYLKLLQLPLVQLEQHVRQEIESNPMLDELDDYELVGDISEDIPKHEESFSAYEHPSEEYDKIHNSNDYEERENTFESREDFTKEYIDSKPKIEDENDPFDFYASAWQDDSEYASKSNAFEDEDYEPFQIKDTDTFSEELYQQLRMLTLSAEDFILGAQIIGNIDDDGYLRRDLQEITDETNSFIADHNFQIQKDQYEKANNHSDDFYKENPARRYALAEESTELLKKVMINHPEINKEGLALLAGSSAFSKKNKDEHIILKQVNLEQAERILEIIQSLDPPGIGSRSVQECLVSQCRVYHTPSPAQMLALDILENAYDAFAKKHYHILTRQFGIGEDELREALDFIRHLNPKPGGGDFTAEHNSVIPDFLIVREEDTDELMISVNDSQMPQIKLSKAYESLKKEAKAKQFNKDTREWIRNKFEDAKFLIQAIRQRKATMMKVMTAIGGVQKDFFIEGRSGLKPLIYKDIAEATGLDISTVCRIVNGKYVQTEFGTYELKFFFSESLPTDDGEDVSTTVIKEIIRDMIGSESKDKPFSDDKLSKDLKEKGYNVARRTVAKYREQMKIPVARLRKEL